MPTTNQCEGLMALATAAEMCRRIPPRPEAELKALAEVAIQTLEALRPDTSLPPPEAPSVSKGSMEPCLCEKCRESHGPDGKLVSLKTIKEHVRSQKRRKNGTSQAVKCERCLCRKEKDKPCITSGPGQPCDFCTNTKQSCSFVPKNKKRTPEHMEEATAETQEPPSKRARTAEAAAEAQECPFRLAASADSGPGVPSVPAYRGFKAINRPQMAP
ncbi:hypothetical protein CSOJ01_13999 [Colletotrichum sojae]|uniref:Uncharacterized protein n=1 Tax=Colletotrichum sojae TaxID=2175907 RepID=A0A8H6IRN6_9PEZI|nr:hypothetical protein CSOJ01_13999 [Colletotrichum sojae]